MSGLVLDTHTVSWHLTARVPERVPEYLYETLVSAAA